MSKIVKVQAGVLYFENSDVFINGEWKEDVEGNTTKPLMPCCVLQENDEYTWNPIIDIEKGKILNWENGVKAVIHYKVCDQCKIDYFENDKFICNNDVELYVPDFLCTTGEGFGDYIIINVEEDGKISYWNERNLDEFDEWVKNNSKNE